MSWGGFRRKWRNLPLKGNRQILPVRLWLTWAVVLVALAVAAGVCIAAGDPDWDGTPPQNLSNSPSNHVWQPSIAAGPAGQMVIAWSDSASPWEDEPRDIYVRRSGDNGSTWSAPEVVSATAQVSALPDVCAVGGQTFVAWVDQSSIGGLNVALYEGEVGTGAGREIQSPTSLSFTQPRLAAGAGRLHIVFNAGDHILHAMRPLAATTWPMAAKVYTSTAFSPPWFPALAVDPEGETLHVVWQEKDFLTSMWTIMYAQGEINGVGVDWQPPLPLDTGSAELIQPDIAADSQGNLHVVWGEAVGVGGPDLRDQYVRYTRYDVASGEWISPAMRIDQQAVRLNRDSPTFTAPSLALSERSDRVEICAVWYGFRPGGFGEQVLLSCSSDQGQSWSAPRNVSRTSGSEDICIEPDVTFDRSGRLHCVWQGHTDQMGDNVVFDHQVFYARAMNKMYMPFFARGAE